MRGPDLVVPGGWVTRVGNVPGNVGAVAGGGGSDDVGVSVPDDEDGVVLLVPLVVLSVGRPMSVVERRTVVYVVDEPEVVVAAKCGGSGRWVPGGRTVSL
ncbi:MAG TPA: hypothetical protein VMD51_07560, partial [Mycobacterium sp.]|nr:hypothetical protein [Mycobacterium sp.]